MRTRTVDTRKWKHPRPVPISETGTAADHDLRGTRTRLSSLFGGQLIPELPAIVTVF